MFRFLLGREIFFFCLAAAFAALFTVAVRKIALRMNIVDRPDSRRKLHAGPTPLLGGMAIMLTFWLLVGYLFFFTDLLAKHFSGQKLLGIFIGTAILAVMGYIDDQRGLSARARIALAAGAALAVVLGGVELAQITNPFGGAIALNFWEIRWFDWRVFAIFGDIVALLWLMGMMFTSKILDGLDGLSSGIAGIGALMIFLLSSTKKFYQPDVGLVALIFAGACLGFLLFNFHPAKIFLGEGGSLFVGFMLGALAVAAGGKIATALLVMAVPALDMARVAVWRLARRQPLLRGDREHLHFRLLDSGFSHRRAVLIFYVIAALFGAAALFLQSGQKAATLLFLAVAMAAVAVWMAKGR